MKNDIIGSFGIIILAIVLVIVASNSENVDSFWWGNLDFSNEANQTQSNGGAPSMNNFIGTGSAQVAGSSVVTEYTENGENCTTSCKVDWKQMPPVPYLFEELQKKYGKKYVVETKIGEYFLWPQNKDKFSQVMNADSVIMESIHDPSGKTLNEQRNQITKILKKLNFKKVKKGNCLVAGNYDFADCLDYYERDGVKCMSMVIYEPMDRTNVEKKEAKVIQTKVVCGIVN